MTDLTERFHAIGMAWLYEEPGWQLLDRDEDPEWELDAWSEMDDDEERWVVALTDLRHPGTGLAYLTRGDEPCTVWDALAACEWLVAVHCRERWEAMRATWDPSCGWWEWFDGTERSGHMAAAIVLEVTNALDTPDGWCVVPTGSPPIASGLSELAACDFVAGLIELAEANR